MPHGFRLIILDELLLGKAYIVAGAIVHLDHIGQHQCIIDTTAPARVDRAGRSHERMD
jgi:hypothetical protein